MLFKSKYLKYKNKYLKLKELIGGKSKHIKIFNKDSILKLEQELEESEDFKNVKKWITPIIIEDEKDEKPHLRIREIKLYNKKTDDITKKDCEPHETNISNYDKKDNINICYDYIEETLMAPYFMKTGQTNTDVPYSKEYTDTIVTSTPLIINRDGRTFEGTIKKRTLYPKPPNVDPNNNLIYLNDAEGTIKYPNGKKEKGTIKDGVLIKGTAIYPGIVTFIGEKINDYKLIDGKKIYPDGYIEEGIFNDNHENRLVQGKKIYPDGLIKHGSFKDNEFNALYKGKKIYPDGYIEEGSFNDNRENRLVQGKKIYLHGYIEEGIFNDNHENILVHGKKIHQSGMIEDGSFNESDALYEGKKIYPDGYIEEGIFNHDKILVQGKKIHRYGDIEKGIFNDDENLVTGMKHITPQLSYTGTFDPAGVSIEELMGLIEGTIRFNQQQILVKGKKYVGIKDVKDVEDVDITEEGYIPINEDYKQTLHLKIREHTTLHLKIRDHTTLRSNIP